MKKLLGYALVGVISAGTTFSLIQYTVPSQDDVIAVEQGTQNVGENNSHFATLDYASVGSMNPDFTQAAAKSVNAVVSIKNFGSASSRVQGNNPFDMFNDPFFDEFFNRGQQQKPQKDDDSPSGAGSGVIISNDGYIVTNNHVVEGAKKLEVTLNNEQTYTATLIGTDPNTDIALIKIDEDRLPYLDFYNSDNLKVGEWVLAVGNPFGLNSTVTAGIVSAKGRGIGILGRKGSHPIESFIQTDAAINPGNSGGALVNADGNLVGINSAIYSQTGSYTGYGFAVPANLAKKVVDDIKNYGRVQRAYLGIAGVDLSNDDMVRQYNRQNESKLKTGEGVLIQELNEDGGSIDAGLEEGDIIKQVDGQKIKSFSALSSIVGRKHPGDKVNVVVVRDGKERSYKVTLTDLKGNTKIRTKSDLTAAERLGAEFEPLTEEQKTRYGIEKGVMITRIEAGGEFQNLGLREGYIVFDINGKEVDTEKDIEKILKNYNGKVSMKFLDAYGRMYSQGFEMEK